MSGLLVDQLLMELEVDRSDVEGEWLADLLRLTTVMNEEIRSMSPEDAGARERLQKWLKRLFRTVREAAQRYEARGFSISVGLPVGVSVSIDWSAED